MGKEKEKAHKINEKGQCPVCKIKPLTYKRSNTYFCFRCDREFNLSTGIQQSNFAYELKQTTTKNVSSLEGESK